MKFVGYFHAPQSSPRIRTKTDGCDRGKLPRFHYVVKKKKRQ